MLPDVTLPVPGSLMSLLAVFAPLFTTPSFSTRARWSADDRGLAVALLVVTLLVPAGHPVLVAVDDTLFKRRGKVLGGHLGAGRGAGGRSADPRGVPEELAADEPRGFTVVALGP
jgi:hypothetical protein